MIIKKTARFTLTELDSASKRPTVLLLIWRLTTPSIDTITLSNLVSAPGFFISIVPSIISYIQGLKMNIISYKGKVLIVY